MSPRTNNNLAEINRTLGILTANDERHAEDRRDLKLSVDHLTTSITLLNSGMMVQAQTLQSIGTQMVRVADEKLSERIAVVEQDLQFWRRVIGAGSGLFWRVAGLVGACGGAAWIGSHFGR